MRKLGLCLVWWFLYANFPTTFNEEMWKRSPDHTDKVQCEANRTWMIDAMVVVWNVTPTTAAKLTGPCSGS